MATMAPGCAPAACTTTPVRPRCTRSRAAGSTREYPDQPQTAGSYLYEPGGSVHTFYCPEDNTEDTVVLLWMEGAQVSFNEDGTLRTRSTTRPPFSTSTETVSAEQGDRAHIRGGAAASHRLSGAAAAGGRSTSLTWNEEE